MQRQRIGLAARERIAPEHQREGVEQRKVREERHGGRVRLVGNAGEGDAVRTQRRQPAPHPGVDPAAVAAVRCVEIEEHRARFAEQRGVRRRIVLAGEGALHEPLHAVADPEAHERLPPRREAEPRHGPVDAPCDVGRRVDQGAVEVERDESGRRGAEDLGRPGHGRDHPADRGVEDGGSPLTDPAPP